MQRLAARRTLCCLVLGLSAAAAVNMGDELYSKDTSGTFYVFADKVTPISDSMIVCFEPEALLTDYEGV